MRKFFATFAIVAAIFGVGASSALAASSVLIKNESSITIAAVWYRGADDQLRKVASFIRPGASKYIRVSCGRARLQFDDVNNSEVLQYRPEYTNICDYDSISVTD